MIVLLCCSGFIMIVLKFEQSARDWQSKQEMYAEMQMRKGEKCEAKKRMLVSDFF